MEETCSDGGGCTEESNTVVRESTSRAARRRRMDIRRLRLVAGVEAAAPTEDSSPKRQRLDCPTNSPEIQGGKDPANDTVEEWMARDDAVASDSSSSSRLITDPELQAPPVKLSDSGHFQRYGMTSICGRRRDMEDAVSILPDFLRHGCGAPETYHFFGVYDGHGCSHVAVLCKDRMHELVAEEMERLESGRPPVEEWKKVMERSFSRMDAEVAGWYRGDRTPSCRCVLQIPLCNNVGSTAVVSVVSTDQIVVANCGDSRAVLCRRGVAVPLSCDHKPDRPDELRRIEAAGGRVIYWDGARVLGVLAMSRAIGDGYLKPFVVSEPEVTVTERTEEDECLILASDGLWDVVTNEMACYIVRTCLRCTEPAGDGDHVRLGVEDDGAWRSGSDKACSDAALLLTKLALARRSSDNVSVVVTDLRRNL